MLSDPYAGPSSKIQSNPTTENKLSSSNDIIAHLECCLDGFREYPADTPFLRGYKAALSLWKVMIESGSINPNSFVEEQLIRLCTKDDEHYRAGFWAALIDVNDDLSTVH